MRARMRRTIERLTALRVKAAMKGGKPGLLADGGNLYLQDGTSWQFVYELDGRRRHMGLGPVHTIGLAEAREKAREARRLLMDHQDPLTVIRASRASLAKAVTFSEAAVQCIEAHKSGWSAKHLAGWRSQIGDVPVVGAMPINEIAVEHVLRAVSGVWTDKPETGSRLRERIEAVLDYATARGLRPPGDNPAAWSRLRHLLPARTAPVKHHAALDYREVAAFMADLRQLAEPKSYALQFCILTATRSAETIGAKWAEVDLAEKLWTIPGARTKSGREHRVPLASSAIAVLDKAAAVRRSDFVFPGTKPNQPLGSTVFLFLLRRMGRGEITAHGFRSSFRDWCGDVSGVSREVAEAALGHVVGGEVELAYRRGDALEKRRLLMDAWAAHCDGQLADGKVVRLRSP
jgi:integrase